MCTAKEAGTVGPFSFDATCVCILSLRCPRLHTCTAKEAGTIGPFPFGNFYTYVQHKRLVQMGRLAPNAVESQTLRFSALCHCDVNVYTCVLQKRLVQLGRSELARRVSAFGH